MKNLNKRLKAFLKDESGQGTVEYILVLIGIVALALLFRTQITEQFQNLMATLRGQLGQF